MRETLITRQPLKGENDDYDSENFWITGGLPSIEGGGDGHWWREKGGVINSGVNSAKSVIKVESRRGHVSSTNDFSESVREITVITIVVI